MVTGRDTLRDVLRVWMIAVCSVSRSYLCVFYLYSDDQELAITEVRHNSLDPVKVDGYQEPGSYVRPIIYQGMHKEQFDELIGRAGSCEQYIKYECYQSKLLSDPGNTPTVNSTSSMSVTSPGCSLTQVMNSLLDW